MSMIDAINEKTPLSGKLRQDDIIFASSGAKAPFVEVEPVRHGKWSEKIIVFRDKYGQYRFGVQCSECCAVLAKTKYCGNCSAIMDRKE